MTKHQKVHKTREAKIAPVAGSSLGPLMYDSLIVKDRREQDFYPKLKTESFGSYRNAGIS
jgi:hypothetical protein